MPPHADTSNAKTNRMFIAKNMFENNLNTLPFYSLLNYHTIAGDNDTGNIANAPASVSCF